MKTALVINEMRPFWLWKEEVGKANVRRNAPLFARIMAETRRSYDRGQSIYFMGNDPSLEVDREITPKMREFLETHYDDPRVNFIPDDHKYATQPLQLKAKLVDDNVGLVRLVGLAYGCDISMLDALMRGDVIHPYADVVFTPQDYIDAGLQTLGWQKDRFYDVFNAKLKTEVVHGMTDRRVRRR